jgi:hypothetical protein
MPRQPKKKKLTQKELFEKRSKAARKGWRTRRKAALVEKSHELSQSASKKRQTTRQVLASLPKKKRAKAEKEILSPPVEKPGKLLTKHSSKKELLERVRELENRDGERQKELDLARLFTQIENNWPKLFGWTKQDGTFAVEYSSLREKPEADRLHQELLDANSIGDLDLEAERMAEHYDVGIREVYTLFFSR